MNPNWLGLAAAALTLVTFLIVYRLTKHLPSSKRIPLALALFIIALPGASFAFYYTHLLPETAWYYTFRSIAGTEFLLLPLGAAAALLATFLPRPLLLLPLLGTATFAIVPFLKPLVAPIDLDTLRDRWDGPVCMQSTPSTCGAASSATIFRHLGIQITEREFARAAHSYSRGTEAWYLARAARAHGVDTHFHFADGFSPDSGLPAIVGVRLGGIGHFITILGEEGEKYIVADPLRGRELLDPAQLFDHYKFTGFHLHYTAR